MGHPVQHRLLYSPLDGDADRHEDAPRVRDRREGVKEELVQFGVDPAAREGEQHVERQSSGFRIKGTFLA